MGLFSKKPKPDLFPWIEITTINQLNDLFQNSGKKPILLFKHSTRCSISSMALNGFERNWKSGSKLCNLYYIDLIKNREVSNLITELTGVTHQSPQAIVIKEKEVLYDDSHSGIDTRHIEFILQKL